MRSLGLVDWALTIQSLVLSVQSLALSVVALTISLRNIGYKANYANISAHLKILLSSSWSSSAG